MHHYLIDLVAGGCLATFSFYFFRTEEVRNAMERREAMMEQAERAERGEPEDDGFKLEDMPSASTTTTNDPLFTIDEGDVERALTDTDPRPMSLIHITAPTRPTHLSSAVSGWLE